MRLLRTILDKIEPLFHKGGKLEKYHAFYEANDTILFTPGDVTKGPTHVRDALDLKRMMITVVVALIPCVLMACYNTGYQLNNAISHLGALPLDNWQEALWQGLGLGYDTNPAYNFLHGLLYFLPIWAITFIVGGHIEVAFAIARKHEINEGFLVTGFLLPLTLPPTIPLWQVAIGIAFGVIIGKEVFGGTGMNILNPALVARAFLFFAYPSQISGNEPWIAAKMPDAASGATLLSRFAEGTGPTGGITSAEWSAAFLGLEPGSMGETSALACLIGAAILIATGVGSWRTMVGVAIGTAVTVLGLQAIIDAPSAKAAMPLVWHFVVGGWAFGAVFMATDPVSSSFDARAKLIYGFGIGMMVSLIRMVNPAYPEGMMLSILFMNMFAPLIDYFFIKANINRRLARHGA